MAYTGYLVSVFMDANPYSPTYGQERTERELDTNECPVEQQPNYVHIYTYCEMSPNGAYTGNCVMVYEDVEPMSATYGRQREEVYTDGVLCPPDSADADWREIESYCEQIEYQPSGKLGNSGFKITVYMDYGEYSPTYHQTREERLQNLVECPLPDTSDVWVIISETCHLVNGLKDGTKDVVRVETNEYSPNYNNGQTETINVPDLELCPLDPESPIWTEVSWTCVLDEGYRTGYVTVVEEDTNPQSATYGQQRTRTYEDEERCPYQEKPQPVSLNWRIINNRSGSTDTITDITLHFNANFDINALGNIPPAGGMLQGTTLLPAALTSTGLVCSSVDLSPNTSLPVIYQFSQNPSPYVWDDTAGSAVLIISLWDGDGTGPEWTEVSYSCETVDGYRTGASIVTEEDTNSQSATYGQQRTRTIENDPRCPAQTDADWVETSWTCETVNGYNTGNRLSVQTDQNPNSSTYGSTRTRIIQDLENCPISTTPAWTEISYVCEQVDGFNSGNTIITEEDKNPGSPTYGQTRTRTVSDDARCVRNTTPTWVEESWVCEQEEPEPDTDPIWVETSRTCILDQNGYNTGSATVVEEDTNPNSATYQQTRTSTVEDLTTCPINSPNWVETSRTCEQSDGYNTGYAIVTETDQNQYSSTYGQTRTITVEDLVNCPLPYYDFKIKSKSTSGTEYVVQCSEGCLDTVGMNKSYLKTAEIGSCVTCIADELFKNANKLTTVTIHGNITSISNSLFSYCSRLTSLDIPSSVNTIGNYAFEYAGLTSITVPNTVTSIGRNAFSHCTGLTSVTLSNSITSISQYMFQGCTSLEGIIIPNTVTTIGESSFNNTKLRSITLPNSITSIGNNAFRSNSYLTSFTCLATTPPTIGTDVFTSTSSSLVIYVPASSVEAYKEANGWSDFASRIQAIPNS